MKYISTRGHKDKLDFEQMMFATLAPDGGLYMPEHFPDFSADLERLAKLSYQELTSEILRVFIGDKINVTDLDEIIRKSYSSFRHPEIVFNQDFKDFQLLELFHGPTWAFKDLALQLLAGLLDHFADKTNKKLLILGSTSGDTGAAALAAFAGKKNIKIIILHPHQKISEVQLKQMTSYQDHNIANIALKGSFDDAQLIIKTIFSDTKKFKQHDLVAINSINLVRIIAQTVYYFYSYFNSSKKINYFCVPTGNFGNALAGLFAKKMGLPIKKLVVATNQNNVLEKCLNEGIYRSTDVLASISPSMDIQIANNFERYLFLLTNKNTSLINDYYQTLDPRKGYQLPDDLIANIADDFLAGHASEKETKQTIKEHYQKYGYVLDPHSAVAVNVAKKKISGLNEAFISVASAHPSKFFDTIEEVLGFKYNLPTEIKELLAKEPKVNIIENNLDLVIKFINDFTK
ncbi:MAG: threonine synthase [SAR324 cluster bacterium]|nr:threonine synthase [SAR324 cluster bacterium]